MAIPQSHRRLMAAAGQSDPTDSSGDVPEEDFDTSMLIILAVLLLALLFALGLNLVLRCGMQQLLGRRSPACTGLKKGTLERMPVAVYRSSDVVSTGGECPICLGEFVDGERVRVLPKCGHGFHARCIDTWLLSHSSCPNCRASLLEVELP